MEKSYYAIIPANIRYDERVTPNAKLLYGEITALTNEKGYCWASNTYFSELYGVSKTSISKWIKQLVDCGYIESRIIYKEGTKEILNRYITIVIGGIQQKLNTPIEEKLKDNNTVFNNTTNITLKDIDEQLTPKKETKHKYGEYKHVSLTDTEYSKLIEEFGEPIIKQYIEKVDEYVEQFGKRYKNYNLTIRNWLKKDGGKRGSIGKNTSTSSSKFSGYKPKPKTIELTAAEQREAEKLI